MALVTQNLLGSLSGRLGNFVLREMNGKSFISARPKSYKRKKPKEDDDPTTTFGKNSKFAAYINDFPEINTIWRNFVSKGQRGYNQIISLNGELVQEGFFSTNNIIVPKGLVVNISEFNCDLENLTISYSLADLNSVPSNANSLKSFFIFCFQEPGENASNPSKLSNIVQETSILNPEIKYNLTNSLSHEIKDLLEYYKTCIIYFTSVFIDSKGNPINWTISQAKSFDFENDPKN
jgi:hypothetical protein